MKFKVTAGVSLDLTVRNENALAIKTGKKLPDAKKPSLREIASGALIVVAMGIFMGTALHGFFTGDFSLMQMFWELVKRHIPSVLKLGE